MVFPNDLFEIGLKDFLYVPSCGYQTYTEPLFCPVPFHLLTKRYLREQTLGFESQQDKVTWSLESLAIAIDTNNESADARVHISPGTIVVPYFRVSPGCSARPRLVLLL